MGIMINPIYEITHIKNWIKNYFSENGPQSKAVVGISGGKDSTIVAALLCEALGNDRVVGVRMPQHYQYDINMATEVCNLLNIKSYEMNIGPAVDEMYNQLQANGLALTSQIQTNNPARVRMATLYMVAAAIGGRVANTCNWSEDYVGYSTKFGDNAGDFSVLGKYTVREVKAIGRAMKYIPTEYIDKTPEDGMCGRSDETNLGFSYDVLDDFLLDGIHPDFEILHRINALHKNSLHKDLHLPICPCSGRYDQFGIKVKAVFE